MLARRRPNDFGGYPKKPHRIVPQGQPLSEIAEPGIRAGLNVMRLNFSHATPEEFFLRVENLAKATGGDAVAAGVGIKAPRRSSLLLIVKSAFH